MMTNSVKKQDRWMMRLLRAICEKMFSWFLSHELSISSRESLMFMTYRSVGWEEAIVQQSLARIKQVRNKEG